MLRRWKGLKALVHDAIDHSTELVDEGHESASRLAMTILEPVDAVRETAQAVDGARRSVTRGVLASIRAVNHLVRDITDAGIDLAASVSGADDDASAPASPVPLRSDVVMKLPWIADAALGALNGVVGNHLESRDNGLALDLTLRSADRYLALEPEALREALPDATGSIVVLVHGLATTEWSWCLEAQQYHGDPATNFGTLLSKDLGFTPVFARYNTGRHISLNARDLAVAIEQLVQGWPVPVERVALVGHSMGGLVSRAAAHVADADALSWRSKLTHVACLGSPHHGAPLEKLGNVLTTALLAIDLPATRIPGRILQGRSAGIKDLRYGALVDEDWLGRDPDALLVNNASELAPLPDVSYCFVSATVTRDSAHPVGTLVGDLLVRVPSAQGERVRERSFAIETHHFGGVMHHQLQNHPDVYAQLRAFLQGREPESAPA